MSSPTTPITVTELTARIKQVIEQGFAQVEVAGEISRLTTPASGHLYFTIKDSHAAISAVVWRSAATRLKTRPKDGQAYVFFGYLSLYEPRGTYQLIVTRIEPAGAGQLAAEFERRKNLFAERGWFDESRKQKIPKLPKHISIVTSATAAAFEDVKKVLATRPAWLNITLSQAIVQGQQAPSSIAQAIIYLHQLEEKPDVILLVRGGGSIEDLWCFNDEKVVQAIYEAKIPIISGVGHEIDTTLADLAADIRAATPSNAAEIACPAKDTLQPQIRNLAQRLRQVFNSYKDARHWDIERKINSLQHAYRQSLRQQTQRLQAQQLQLQQHEPNQRLRRNTQTFYNLKQRLTNASRQHMPNKQTQLTRATHHLRQVFQAKLQQNIDNAHKYQQQLYAMNPHLVLKRGYAMTTDALGKVVSSAQTLQQGDKLHLHFHDGNADVKVTQTKE
ncbi:MAG: exodeoxyribonuclease VII large subunit [Ghiorsea sp.]